MLTWLWRSLKRKNHALSKKEITLYYVSYEQLLDLIRSGRTSSQEVKVQIAKIYAEEIRMEQGNWHSFKQSFDPETKKIYCEHIKNIFNAARTDGKPHIECAAGFVFLSLELSYLLSQHHSIGDGALIGAAGLEDVLDKIITHAIEEYTPTKTGMTNKPPTSDEFV